MKAQFSNFEIYYPKSYNADTFIIGWWDDEVRFVVTRFPFLCFLCAFEKLTEKKIITQANTLGAPKFIFFEPALKKEKY